MLYQARLVNSGRRTRRCTIDGVIPQHRSWARWARVRAMLRASRTLYACVEMRIVRASSAIWRDAE